MKAKISCLIAVAALAVLSWTPPASAEEPLILGAEETETQDSCLDYSPAEELEAAPALVLTAPDMEPVAPRPPKPCKNGCKPSYNGWPRISCDPCCYNNDIGIPICTS